MHGESRLVVIFSFAAWHMSSLDRVSWGWVCVDGVLSSESKSEVHCLLRCCGEQIRSLSHFLIISLRFFPTLRFNLFKRGDSLENRSCREFIVKWIIVNCVCSYYYFLRYTKRSSPGKSPVLSLSFSVVSCFRSIKKYQYGALVAFLKASIIKALFPGYICQARLATCDASRTFLNKTK